MKTIAIQIDDELLSKAELKARALDTSVPDVVGEYLRSWASETIAIGEAQELLKARFAQRDWQFSVGTPDNREQRNARR